MYPISRSLRIVLLVVFLVGVCGCSVFKYRTVETSAGAVKGAKEGKAIVFRGIPYAQPPVGSLRFKAPQPAKKWAGTLNCPDWGNKAAQYNGGTKKVEGTEDCLNLNVFTPTTNSSAKLPVVVWIHGGAMIGGSGVGWDGHVFADRDSIVTVTINYRLGVFGFMYMGDTNTAYNTSGNNGLQDCIMALKWVKENIAAFGGDPSRVTVMGESAGAKLAATLLVSPSAKGYFNQLILESGGVQCVRDTMTAKDIRTRILKELKLSNPSDLIKLSTEQLITAQAKVCKGVVGTNYFGPVMDGVIIKQDPYEFIKNNKYPAVRLLIGSNTQEARMFMDGDKRLYEPNKEVLEDWFGLNSPLVLANYQQALKQQEQKQAAINVLSQYMYQMHSYRMADAVATAGYPVWVYRFDYNKKGIGATHTQEMPFIWYSPDNNKFDATEKKLAELVHGNWANFIKGKVLSNWGTYAVSKRDIMFFDKRSHEGVLPYTFNDAGYPSAGFILK